MTVPAPQVPSQPASGRFEMLQEIIDRFSKVTTPEEAHMLDEILEKIDKALPCVVEMARRVANGETVVAASSINGMSRSQFKRAQKLFQQMAEDPLLNREGTDIQISKRRRRSKKKENGS